MSDPRPQEQAPAPWVTTAGSAQGGASIAVGLAAAVAAQPAGRPVVLGAHLRPGIGAGTAAAMTGAIFIANKVLLLTCVVVMGKAGFQQLKGVIFGYVKGLAPADTIGPTRHAIGLVMFCLPLVSAMLEPYVDQFWPGLRPNIWQLQALGDFMLIASFFVLGGDFWSKVRALFIRTAKVEDTSVAQAPPR